MADLPGVEPVRGDLPAGLCTGSGGGDGAAAAGVGAGAVCKAGAERKNRCVWEENKVQYLGCI